MKKLEKGYLHRWLTMARRRLAMPRARKTDLLREIRRRFPEAPQIGSNQALVEWYSCAILGTDPPAPHGRVMPLVDSDAFLRSYEWRSLRMVVLKARGRRCECCGAQPTDGVTVLHVDHIKPRRLFPALALDVTNLQVLCEPCNHGKGNWDQTDWRPPTSVPVETLNRSILPRLVKKG